MQQEKERQRQVRLEATRQVQAEKERKWKLEVELRSVQKGMSYATALLRQAPSDAFESYLQESKTALFLLNGPRTDVDDEDA